MAAQLGCKGTKHMALTIERRTAGDIVILSLKGRATIGRDTDALNDALRGELNARTRRLVVNFSQLTQIDSSGLATVVRTFVSMQRAGLTMRLVIPPGHVREVFDVLQLSSAISCVADEASVLDSFR
jgi:anti-sigma B factor antagonist